MATKYLHGVWRPGKGAQFWRTGMSFNELKAQDAEHTTNGLRMFDLVHSSGDGYTALWRQGSGSIRWVAGVNGATAFKAFDTQFFDEGFRIFAATRRSRYCGIWRPGSGEQHWRSGMTFKTMKAEDQKHFDNGLRLATIETYKKGSGHRYFAYWRPGKGAQWWMAGDGISGADQAYFNLGYRIKARSHGGVGNGAFVWTKGSGAQWWTAKTVSGFKTFDKQKFDQGLRLTYLSVGFGF